MRIPENPLREVSLTSAMTSGTSARWQMLGWLMFAVGLIIAPRCFPSAASLTLLSQIGTAAILALSFNLLLGETGMLSFCHATYAGLGAFAGVWLMNRIGAGWALSMIWVPLVSGLAGAAGGALLGFVTTRRAGLTFAMITLGVAELVWVGAMMLPDWFGGERGITTDRTLGAPWLGLTFESQREIYYLIATWLFASTAIMYGFTRTPLGYLARAVRDNPMRVAFLGTSPVTVRYQMQIVATFFAGVAGGLSALNFELVSADVFNLERSGAVLIFTVLGGTGYFAGPLVGAVVGVMATVVLASVTRAWQLYLGLGFLLVVVWAPGGLAGLVAAHVKAWRQGLCESVWRPYLATVMSIGWILAGTVALIEMTYHLRFDVERASSAPLWLGDFTVNEPFAWGLSVAYVLLGLFGLRFARPALTSALRLTTAEDGS